MQGSAVADKAQSSVLHIMLELWAGGSPFASHTRRSPFLCSGSRGADACGQHLLALSLSGFQSDVRGQEEKEFEMPPLK